MNIPMGESPLARGQHSEARQVAGWFALRRTGSHLAGSRLRECSQLFSVFRHQYISKSGLVVSQKFHFFSVYDGWMDVSKMLIAPDRKL
jgi:hypothetical protein